MGMYDKDAEKFQKESLLATKESNKQTKRMFDYQIYQGRKIARGTESKEAKTAAEKQKAIELGKKGRKSTIKTIQQRPSYDTFAAKYKADKPFAPPDITKTTLKDPLTIPDEFTKENYKPFADIELENNLFPGTFSILREQDPEKFKELVDKYIASPPASKAKTETVADIEPVEPPEFSDTWASDYKQWEKDHAAWEKRIAPFKKDYEKQIKTAYEKEQPFRRLITNPATVKKKVLSGK